MSGLQSKRYQQLGLRDALSVHYRYPLACDELSLILQEAYNQVPKSVQSLIFDDVVSAFRLLPGMQTQSAFAAVHNLRNTAERILPKQKKKVAISEFKQAKITHKRNLKAHQDDEGPVELPQDVLVLIFEFLDIQSMVLAAQVCRLWNEACDEKILWQLYYTSYFGDLGQSVSTEKQQRDRSSKDSNQRRKNCVPEDISFDWKDAFRQKYVGSTSSRKFKYNRGYCAYCKLIVWANGLRCPKQHYGKGAEDLHIVSMIASFQIVEYLVVDLPIKLHDSDSDSSDDEVGFWVAPKLYF